MIIRPGESPETVVALMVAAAYDSEFFCSAEEFRASEVAHPLATGSAAPFRLGGQAPLPRAHRYVPVFLSFSALFSCFSFALADVAAVAATCARAGFSCLVVWLFPRCCPLGLLIAALCSCCLLASGFLFVRSSVVFLCRSLTQFAVLLLCALLLVSLLRSSSPLAELLAVLRVGADLASASSLVLLCQLASGSSALALS
jgi:hypothetical protein